MVFWYSYLKLLRKHTKKYFFNTAFNNIEGDDYEFFKYCILYLKVSGRFDLYAAFYEDTLINLVLTFYFKIYLDSFTENLSL